MFKLIAVILFFVASSVLARSAVGHVSQSLSEESSTNSSSNNGYLSDVLLLYKIYRQCTKENLSTCLKVKLIMGLDKAVRYSKDLKLVKGVQFLRDEDSADVNTVQSENDIEKDLPRSLEEKDAKLNSIILEKFLALLKSHTLQIKLPSGEDLEQPFSESRKKSDKKNNGAFIMIPLLLGGTFIPIAYGALALLAGKALIVSKLALVLASIIGIKKLLSSSGKESQHEVVVSGGHGSGSGWGRDFDLAYNAYMPKDKVKV